ncbi:TRM5 [Blepharisma stoltei]|uniref:SAM-dependent methyltransferase TRM5/TYW2-type domain-containing protein n=1 Tax=Blepharisma stoltei TaxID=1481888 RepID=A0AAU9JW67_9CILI|nr:unnamed protein product [Blepharisma stoltei]
MDLIRLDKERFNSHLCVKAIKVSISQVSTYLLSLSSHLLNKPGVSNIDKCADPQSRLILLDESLSKLSTEELPDSLTSKILDNSVEIIDHTLDLSYDSYSFQEILRQLLPNTLPILPNFETIGDLAYIRLIPDYSEHSRLIGEVILDKSGKKCVVGIFQDKAEVIAGSGDTKVNAAEHNLHIKYDFLKAPLAAGLESERNRLLEKFEKNSVICDTCAGVGHLALLAAQKGYNVISNSENEENYEALVANAINNQLDKKIYAFNQKPLEMLENIKESWASNDDKEAEEIQTQMVHYLLRSPDFNDLPHKKFNHLILEVKDPDFQELEKLYGFFKGVSYDPLPNLHFYVESSAAAPKEDIIEKLSKAWMHKIKDSQIQEVHYVRDKLYCISLQIPQEVAFSQDEILRSEGSVSEEENSEDLRETMSRQMDFMQRSIRESELVHTSLLMSNLNSLIISQQGKRQQSMPESPTKRFRPNK